LRLRHHDQVAVVAVVLMVLLLVLLLLLLLLMQVWIVSSVELVVVDLKQRGRGWRRREGLLRRIVSNGSGNGGRVRQMRSGHHVGVHQRSPYKW
jgi:uncharacterized membrane-anchored protein